jgi:hypothetical protein
MYPDPQATPSRYRFVLGPASPIATGPGTDSNGSPLVVIVSDIYVDFKTFTLEVGTPTNGLMADIGTGGAGPTGADLVVDIDSSPDGSTWTSIFGGNQAIMPRLPAGRVSQLTTDANGGRRFNNGTYLRTNVLQVGSIVAGQNVVLTCAGFALED